MPTICPYGTPIKVVFEKVFANNDHSSKPVVVEISSNGKEGLPKNMELFKAEDEDSMYLEPHQIERKVCTIVKYLVHYFLFNWHSSESRIDIGKIHSMQSG